jgi:acyl dehydratase
MPAYLITKYDSDDNIMSKTEFPTITEQGLDALRGRVGVKIENTLEPWCHEATRDNIRHYAHGIGDDNPLWCDPAYAAGTRYGGLIAPPSFLFACSRIISGYVGGLPGIHAMWAGADWHWHGVVERNDEITTQAWLKDLVLHETRFSGRSVQQIYHVDFYKQDGTLLCEADSWCFRTERDTAREKGTKYSETRERGDKRYTDEELVDIYRHYANEEVQGAAVRYGEDVSVGDQLPTMVKGPMTVTGFIAYAQGWGGLYIRANKIAWQQIHKHPGLGIKNRFGIPDCPERVHWEEEFAHEVGAPGAYDYGPERCSWMTHQLTNWMGDEGFLERSYCEIRRHNPAGDVLFINAQVTKKERVDDGWRITLSQEARQQDDELSVQGHGAVRLPARD